MKISDEHFKKLVNPLLGLPISRIWRGYGTSLFIELGKLSTKSNRLKNGKRISYQIGQISIFIGWDWRIERTKSIYFGSWSKDKIVNSRLPQLKGRTIISVDYEGRLPELVIKLSNGLWIHSFHVGSTGDTHPAWHIHYRKKGSHLFVGSYLGGLAKHNS